MADRIVLVTCATWPELSASDGCPATALEARGCHVEAAPWNGAAAPFAGADAVVIRAAWDYHQDADAYRFTLMEVEVNEPGLGLDLVPGAADRFAEAILARLGGR